MSWVSRVGGSGEWREEVSPVSVLSLASWAVRQMERGGESSESGELGGSGKWREEVSQVSCVSRGGGRGV